MLKSMNDRPSRMNRPINHFASRKFIGSGEDCFIDELNRLIKFDFDVERKMIDVPHSQENNAQK
jgi:hypothetical protein